MTVYKTPGEWDRGWKSCPDKDSGHPRWMGKSDECAHCRLEDEGEELPSTYHQPEFKP